MVSQWLSSADTYVAGSGIFSVVMLALFLASKIEISYSPKNGFKFSFSKNPRKK